jgi:hypothetical protein
MVTELLQERIYSFQFAFKSTMFLPCYHYPVRRYYGRNSRSRKGFDRMKIIFIEDTGYLIIFRCPILQEFDLFPFLPGLFFILA